MLRLAERLGSLARSSSMIGAQLALASAARSSSWTLSRSARRR